MWNYTQSVLDHFQNPRNVGEIENPDGLGEIGSLSCGDMLRLTIKIGPDERITDAMFRTFGCASAIASSSVLTEMIKGMTVDEALQVTNQDIAEQLGGLPEEKMHCSVMGREALEAAIADYRGEEVKQHDEGEVVCKCFGVTDAEIEREVRDNKLATVDQVTHYTKAGGGCGQCKPQIEEIIKRVRGELLADAKTAPQKRPEKLTNIEKMKLTEETINREIRPALQRDGGDLELIDIDGSRVLVALRGTCTNCPSADFTVTEFVEAKLREYVSEDLTVEVQAP